MDQGIVSIVNSAIVGGFTLVSALGGVGLGKHLESKRNKGTARKEKALQAYSLLFDMPILLNGLLVACDFYLKGKLNMNSLYKDFGHDKFFSSLERLELLFLESLYDLHPDFRVIKGLMFDEYSYLSEVRCMLFNNDKLGFSVDEFKQRSDVYRELIKVKSSLLQKKINEMYINKQRPKQFPLRFIQSLWVGVKDRFEKLRVILKK